MTLTLRHSEAGDIEPMQRLASRVWPAGWHPGGLGWALARGELADEVVVVSCMGPAVKTFLGMEPN